MINHPITVDQAPGGRQLTCKQGSCTHTEFVTRAQSSKSKLRKLMAIHLDGHLVAAKKEPQRI
jgi:hypothetical protein